MRSQIPRPDQPIAKVVQAGGRTVYIMDEVWYRFLTAEHGDTAQIEVDAILALAAKPDTSQIKRTADDARVLALVQPNYETRIDDLTRRVKALEALTYGR